MRQVLRVLAQTLREIFDENAYARFLARHQLASSPEAYARFISETKRPKPRCC